MKPNINPSIISSREITIIRGISIIRKQGVSTLKNSSAITKIKNSKNIIRSFDHNVSTAQILGKTVLWNPMHMCSSLQTHDVWQERNLHMPSTTINWWVAKCAIPAYLKLPKPYQIHRIKPFSISNAILEEMIQYLKAEPSTGALWLAAVAPGFGRWVSTAPTTTSHTPQSGSSLYFRDPGGTRASVR